jgi:hypothetical protein
MANQSQSIPEPVPQPSHASPSPHSLTPAGWEESAGFRETFLRCFYVPEDHQALRHLSRMLHESGLEMARYAPSVSSTPKILPCSPLIFPPSVRRSDERGAVGSREQ